MKDTRKLGGAGVFIIIIIFFHVLSQFSRSDNMSLEQVTCYNLVPRSLFPGFGGGRTTSKAREKRPGDEVVLAMKTTNRQLRIGGGGVRVRVRVRYLTNIWVWVSHPDLGQEKKFLKYTPCRRTTPSILLPCLEQRTKCGGFVLKLFIGDCYSANSRYSHHAVAYLEYKQNSRSKSNQSFR